ncbi:MAG TPA: J domain-containing protein [Methylomirabilota bacterium]
MRKRDYYEVLGVSREAPVSEIRQAYRRLARRYSPDVNLWDARAEALFEEIREAFRVIADPTARPLYDRLGHQAFEPAADAPDAGPAPRGEDIHYPMELELHEALGGVQVQIELTRLDPCDACGASGGSGGRSAEPCRTCQGRPVRVTLHRDRPVATRCGACGGTGWRLPPPCPGCSGRGTRAGACRLQVAIPPGVDTGAQVRIPGEGHAAPAPGRRGDLIVITRVRPHPLFSRKGDHLQCEVPLTVPEAALGTRIEIPAPGGPVVVRIPPGTQAGQTLRIRGRGCPRLGREGRGDLLVETRVVIPRNPDPALEEVLQALRRLLPENPRAEIWAAPGARAEGGR